MNAIIWTTDFMSNMRNAGVYLGVHSKLNALLSLYALFVMFSTSSI